MSTPRWEPTGAPLSGGHPPRIFRGLSSIMLVALRSSLQILIQAFMRNGVLYNLFFLVLLK